MPKRLDRTIMGRDYASARAYVKREHPSLLDSKNAQWYAPLVEAHVAGARCARRRTSSGGADGG
jgi:hypothetical protein